MLISKGGGIYERKAKSIALSPEARARFGIAKEQVTPAELMKTLLKAEVDLLFFGGIGTYVRASDETNAEVGDRANDALRVTGEELRAKVVGEGANLGVTQRGRVEAASKGVKLNTDAVDNSAGVDTSDHEVNIKILLNEAVQAGDLDHEAARQAAGADDRRRGRAGAARQLPAVPGAQHRGGAELHVARPAEPLHEGAGAQRPARSRHRVPAGRRVRAPAPHPARRPDAAGDGGPARLRQEFDL